jgi:phospholipid transport system substrate-binding protein
MAREMLDRPVRYEAMNQEILALLMVATATAQPVTTPREVVQTAVARVVAVVTEQQAETVPGRGGRGDAERARTEIRRVAGDLFDFGEMSRRALSRHWAARTATEQVEFVRLFTDLLERGYLSRIQSYAGEKIVYLGEGIDGPFATVKSRVMTANRRTEIALDYRLIRKDGKWKVYDVLVDGASFVSSYRSEFDRVIQSAGYESLVERMRAKGVVPVAPVGRLF